jgi:hypothetical protein
MCNKIGFPGNPCNKIGSPGNACDKIILLEMRAIE